MSRELLLVPKAKYESMLKLLGEENQQSVITEHSQEGSQIDKKNTNAFQDSMPAETNSQPSDIVPPAPAKTPSKFHVKRSLSDMTELFEQNKGSKKRPKLSPKSKWVNYVIS